MFRWQASRRTLCLSPDWDVSGGEGGNGKVCHVHALFLVSDDSLNAGKLMAAKFMSGHSNSFQG